ncbi:MAG: phospho-sugar mutase [Eggerthellaceae bacterium]|nr:phospho-sugar mutase [Eggerthellaceae bacterium]
MAMMDIRATLKRWKMLATEIDPEEFEVLEHDEEALADAFIRDLEFGTAGLRGIIGAGSNRMNVYTVAQATQGLANYLNRTFDNPSVAIARDSRNMGEEFCEISAGVLAANGVRALLYPRIEPTPALSFAVRDLHCSAGICMTASHNRAEYNGYKVYGPDGCQITTQAAKDIQSEIGCVDIFDDVTCMDFEEGIEAGLISWIGDDTIDRFIDCCAQASLSSEKGPLSVVYTPLHGTGLECVTKILERIGVSDLTIEPDQAIPNGDFPTCPYPNPEVREALERGLALAEEKQADLLLATDPDADRVGIAVVKDGEPVLLTGNETGILLTDYICTMLSEKGCDLKDKVVISTIVSSTMLDELCKDRGFELRRTLTGFKYIGEQIGYLEAEGQADRYAFGFEESYGYLAGTHVRDKDAVVTSMLICEMARWYRAKGMDLIDALNALYAKYGYFENAVVSFGFAGSDGIERMADVLTKLRAERPTRIANLAVESSVDYEPGIEMPIMGGKGDAQAQILPSANVLEYALEGQSKLIIRPSGTEPKIKVYVFAKGATKEESARTLASLKEAAGELLA